jgi:hypothetical protein
MRDRLNTDTNGMRMTQLAERDSRVLERIANTLIDIETLLERLVALEEAKDAEAAQTESTA